MNAANPLPMALHEDVALFGEALRFTAAETGFISRLIEKGREPNLFADSPSKRGGDGQIVESVD